ncbi:malate synthase A [Chryseobacterium sp. LAM-KRS1]|uniref:malate synthase A n=1 Tax=Chryseobacterium sp. LAM-KRS1 TaxID=2715754 RepID=UPI00155642DD|nr:malate synthase A [Chryseobacterium sp. LAM-KRS1]
METTTQLRIKAQSQFEEIFNPELIEFLIELHQNFNAKRLDLLEERKETQLDFDRRNLPRFLPQTEEIRNGDWVCSPLPEDLLDRRVEITGPVDRKMIINALNSGASTFMADFEDSNAPTWKNCMEGQINLSDAINRSIDFTTREGKAYQLQEKTAVLLVRPRGLHLHEKHIEINGEEASGSLVDFGIYFFRNAQKLLEKGSGPYFYLPKLEHYKEARWWNEVFDFAQNYLQIPRGTIKATVLIETITASFQIDEILYELKKHSAGLNCGRWDYIFSFIKKFRNLPEFIIPDRDQVTMTSPFMTAYSKRVIEICHKRNVHAIGGMAAQIPIKNDDQANHIAFEKVKADKEREVKNGHDGTWVAHPALVSLAKDIFDEYMPSKNQIDKKVDYQIKESDLLEIPKGEISERGVRKNINVGILYLESWLMGIGAAAIYNLMEDAATAEISRTQIWQWLKNEAVLIDDRILTREMVLQWEREEMDTIEKYVGEERFKNGKFNLAKELFNELIFSEKFEEFLTLKAYPFI